MWRVAMGRAGAHSGPIRASVITAGNESVTLLPITMVNVVPESRMRLWREDIEAHSAFIISGSGRSHPSIARSTLIGPDAELKPMAAITCSLPFTWSLAMKA